MALFAQGKETRSRLGSIRHPGFSAELVESEPALSLLSFSGSGLGLVVFDALFTFPWFTGFCAAESESLMYYHVTQGKLANTAMIE
jgi:hypothetical protein